MLIAHAQTFDAASIKVNRSPTLERGLIGLQPGRFVANEATLAELIGVAHGVPNDRVVGATGWMASERYDVVATVSGGTADRTVQVLLRALLESRFRLKTHREQRDLPVYTLVRLDRAKLGPGLRPTGAQCAAPVSPPGVPMPPSPPPMPAGTSIRPLGTQLRARCPTMFFSGMVSARGMTVEGLAGRLTGLLSRPVLDHTGLTGEFDIDLYYQTGVSPGGDTGVDANAPALLSAVQAQLGLKLEPGRAPLDVVQIDAAERPSEN